MLRNPFHHVLKIAIALIAGGWLNACAPQFSGPPGVSSKTGGLAGTHMIAAAHPLASDAGLQMLRRGGAAIDAAIAAQMVLTLVEPQSSGIGGGAFLLHYNAESGGIDSYDGRETAPASAHPRMFLKRDGKPKKFYDAAVGGSSIGVPGIVRMLEMVHQEHGKLPWKELFQPAIRLATEGFKLSPRLAGMLEREKYLRRTEAAAAYFYHPSGAAKEVGTTIKNPALADTLSRIANEGAIAMYLGPIAEDIARTVRNAARNPGGMKPADLARYRAKKRKPVCSPYRTYTVCGMGPPSSGGLTTLQILGMLANFDLPSMAPGSPEAVHLLSEASALAFADRNAYIGDSDFVTVPVRAMLNAGYLQNRARLINPSKAGGRRKPGNPETTSAFDFAPQEMEKGHSTTHLSVIDADRNALSMTSSIESAFGSRQFVRGFLLNNQLTDFSFRPTRNGKLVANGAAPGKRPRSSMSPTLVFDGNGKVVMAVGSPGGSRIIGYVTKTLIGVLDWRLSMQDAIDLPIMLNRNRGVELEKGAVPASLVEALERNGHKVKLITRASGLQGVRVTPGGLQGGADKRREGVAYGD